MDGSMLPIEDTVLAATDGVGKDLLIRGNRGHMVNLGAEDLLHQWIDNTTASHRRRPTHRRCSAGMSFRRSATVCPASSSSTARATSLSSERRER